MTGMKTRDLSQTSRTDEDLQPRAPRDRHPERVASTESHWDELHGDGNGSAHGLAAVLRQQLAHRAWTDLAVGVAAGFAAGWLLSSRHRSHAVRDLLVGSLLPAASRRVHHAYDAVRGNGTLRDLGHRVGELKSRW